VGQWVAIEALHRSVAIYADLIEGILGPGSPIGRDGRD
jgi:hypothetical protein